MNLKVKILIRKQQCDYIKKESTNRKAYTYLYKEKEHRVNKLSKVTNVSRSCRISRNNKQKNSQATHKH